MSARLFAAAVLAGLLLLPQLAHAAAPPAGLAGLRASERAVVQQLRAVVSIHFQDTPLRDVIANLRAAHGVNLVVDEQALNEIGVSIDSPISMKLDRVSLGSSLRLLLEQVHLVSVVDGPVVRITTREHRPGDPVPARYPVADLMARMEPAELIDLITRSLAPRSWQALGRPCSIAYCPETGSLKVVQTRDVQEEVGDLLAALRRLNREEFRRALRSGER